jgi:hypothetical protein
VTAPAAWAGVVTRIWVSLIDVIVPAAPPKSTDVALGVVEKLAPVIVTDCPPLEGPFAGVMLPSVGGS